MSALLESLASGFQGEGARRAALDAALRDGLPGARSEAWKYTSLRALERRSFALQNEAAQHPVSAIDPAGLASIPSPRLVFVNGIVDAASSDVAQLPDGVSLGPLSALLSQGAPREVNFLDRRFERADEIFARLNAALAREGAVLRVAENAQVAQPLHLVFIGAPAETDLAWHARHLIELRPGASVTLVEHHYAQGAHANLGNALTHVHVAAGATLVQARIQDESTAATLFSRTDAVLARGAHYRRIDLELGAALSRHELNVRLEGTGARLSANGVLLGNARRHLDTRLGIEHIALDTSCDLLWRGLAADRSRAAFHGGITIRAGADGSDANLSNKNLLLSEGAEIDSQPVLEIHADEVKAAHGATVGQLDPGTLFYLRSRGLPEREARQLLTAAFCREAVTGTADAGLRASLEAALDASLARLGQAS